MEEDETCLNIVGIVRGDSLGNNDCCQDVFMGSSAELDYNNIVLPAIQGGLID